LFPKDRGNIFDYITSFSLSLIINPHHLVPSPLLSTLSYVNLPLNYNPFVLAIINFQSEVNSLIAAHLFLSPSHEFFNERGSGSSYNQVFTAKGAHSKNKVN
jgi:hypothetical protein